MQAETLERPTKCDIYSEITDKIIAQIEAGILPWVQPWAGGSALSLPKNASTAKSYSGVNILLLWDALFARGYDRNKWLTFKQAIAIGGAVRKGEKGTTAVYADSFVPKKEQEAASQRDGEPRRVERVGLLLPRVDHGERRLRIRRAHRPGPRRPRRRRRFPRPRCRPERCAG